MKIIRLTRHKTQPAQDAEIQRIWGPEADVIQVSESLPMDSREAVSRFDEIAVDADVVEAVLPIGLIEAILKFSNFSKERGIVVRAITNRTQDAEGNVSFDFSHYEKIIKVETVTEQL